jgi:ankyrin repeat protein
MSHSHAHSHAFAAAFDALKRRDFVALRARLAASPSLLRAHDGKGNTLLNLAVGCFCNGEPSERLTREEALAAMRMLIDAGADVDGANVHGWTPLHQAAYANVPEFAELLLAADANPLAEARGEGGTPLAVALFWGHREIADRLAEVAIAPENLRIAAALGRAELIARHFGPDGALLPNAARGRGFYRPHSGFPEWRPSSDAQEILDEALVWAAKSDRVEVMPLLVARGAKVSADPYRGTPLLWAASRGRTEAARWLLANGADVNQRATFGGPSHGERVTALHLAAQNDQVAMVQLLLDGGADVTITDGIYDSTAAGWARHEGSQRVLALLGA